MEKLIDNLEKLDYKTFLIMTDLEGVRQLKNMAASEQNFKDAVQYRDLERFIESDEYLKMSNRKKQEEREKKLLRINKK
jgi:hypothetical protein